MKLGIPALRLLPMTIICLAALLVVKFVWLARAWPGSDGMAMVGVAQAAEHGGGHEKRPAEPAKGHGAPASAHGAPPKAAPPPQPPPEPAPPPGPPPVSESERAVLLELRQRRQDIERRDATVAARESVLTAAEQKIASRVEEMKTLQKNLEALETARQQREEASWQGLVKLYETMKPREAAAIFNDLTMSVLQPLISRMKEAKAAPILAAMTPDKARDVTARIARARSRLDNPAEPPVTSNPANPSLGAATKS